MISDYRPPLQADLRRMRRTMGETSPAHFAKIYLGALCFEPFSQMHQEMFQELERLIQQRGGRLAIAAPRGHAKSTIVTLAFVLWCVLYRTEKLILLISATKEQAQMLLKHIKEQLQQNVLLLEDFPDACAPEGAKGRAKPWRESCILLRNQTMIHAYGAGQNLRGARHGKERPGLIVVDDLEDQEHVIVEEQRDKLSQWFNSTLLHAGHPDTNVIAVGTILHHDSLLANLTGPKSTWRKKTYRAVITFSNRPNLWETWAAIYIEEEEWQESTGADAAAAFFQANREAMLEGTEVLWPEREDYCTLMIIRQQVGRGSFQAEKQNEPLDPDVCLFSRSKLYFWEDEYKDEKHLLESVGPGSIYGACDPSLGKSAHSGDYSAIVIVYREHKSKTKYVLVADLARRSPDQTVERIIEYARMYRISGFSVEGNHFQELMIDNLKRRVREAGVRLNIRTVKNRSNKQARIAAMEPEICQGWIRFSRQHQLLLDQLRGFPVAKHDDGPDALEMVVTARHNKLTVRQF